MVLGRFRGGKQGGDELKRYEVKWKGEARCEVGRYEVGRDEVGRYEVERCEEGTYLAFK